MATSAGSFARRALPSFAVAALVAASACDSLRPAAAIGPMVEEEFAVDRGDAADADVHVAFYGGKIRVGPDGKDRLVELTARDNLDDFEPRLDQRRDGTHVNARLWIDTEKDLRLDNNDNVTNEWNVALGTKTPLSLELGMAACTGNVDLGGVPLRRVRASLGAGDATIVFSKPNPEPMDELVIESGAGNFTIEKIANARSRSIRVEAGAGQLTLECGGEWRDSAILHIKSGMCSVELRVPADLAVRVETHDGLFADVKAPDFRSDDKNAKVSPAWGNGGPELLIDVSASWGSVKVVRE